MPTLSRDQVYEAGCRILEAAGASPTNAALVADHLVEANLAGHDSHGVIRVPQYVDDIRAGRMDPQAEPEVVDDAGAMFRVDGHRGFGQVAARFATEQAVERAGSLGLAFAAMCNLNHAGRIGAYGEQAARSGMAAIMFTGLRGTRAEVVTPHHGASGRFSTNPISIAFPYRPDAPALLDFATSIGAEGKLRVYRARGHELPEPWVLDENGAPSRDPNDFYAGGALLPIGGLHGGHKGYALSFMTTVMGNILAERGRPPPQGDHYTSGSSMIVIDISRLGSLEALTDDVDELVNHARSAPLSPGAERIWYPGEKESVSRRERLAGGIEVESATWNQIVDLAAEYDISL